MKTILIIDDDDSIRDMYGLALESDGYRVLTAASGAEGLELARRHSPDLVLSDINMPGLDGRGVLRALRDDPELGAKPVVLMTGNQRDITPRNGMELGADDFLLKPFTNEELARCVNARLQRAEVHRRVEDKIVTELRSSLHRTLPHEFLTPLSGIMGLTQLLIDEYPELSPKEVLDMLLNIDRSGKRLHRTMKNYFAILELPAGAGGPPDAVLSPPATRAAVLSGIDVAAQRHKRSKDVVTTLADCALRLPEQTLATIVEELVDNACSFSRPGTLIKLDLDFAGVLKVQDAGRGMSPTQVAQIGAFRQFDRKKYEQQGLGLGLILAQQLLAQCGGSLAFTSELGVGTTVTVQFPTSPA